MAVSKPVYTIQRMDDGIRLADAPWENAESGSVDSFRPEGSNHRPKTTAKLLYDSMGIFGRFEVQDRYVICRHGKLHDPVCQDSCVEFFVKPAEAPYYLNAEWNAHGVLYASYVYDPTRGKDGFADARWLDAETAGRIQVSTTLTIPLGEEHVDPVSWQLTFYLPFDVIMQGERVSTSGQPWTGNFYKCADRSSHPHWASWAPVPELNFHDPDAFGMLNFSEE